jgi:hypothetical protein
VRAVQEHQRASSTRASTCKHPKGIDVQAVQEHQCTSSTKASMYRQYIGAIGVHRCN